MNPCPCGYLGDENGLCYCSAEQVSRYRNRVSWSLLDRINLHVEVSWPKSFLLQHEGPTPESSEQVRSRVIAARAIQEQRAGCTNAHLESAGLMLDVWQALLARAFALRCLRLPKLGQTRKLLHGDLPAGQEALKAATARP